MGKPARFDIAIEGIGMVILKDLGPWNTYLTITNDAENVVRRMVPGLRGRRLFYYDSEDELTELLIKDGKFAGFKGVRLETDEPASD